MKYEAALYDIRENGLVACKLCAHRCVLRSGQWGICRVRKNVDGSLRTYTYGDVIAAQVDPIEKKPLYHVLPGSESFSIATPGCNFRCDFCQNWNISQKHYEDEEPFGTYADPETIVSAACDHECLSISYTYTEPTVYFEYARACARQARERGLKNIFVSNGYMTQELIQEVRPYLTAINIDLKSFNDTFYQTRCKASLKPVCDAIRACKEAGIWVEVTTLLIPQANDDAEELRALADFLVSVDPLMPWHISRFRPQYECKEVIATPIDTLWLARDIGCTAGLKYVYLGNVPGEGTTRCHACNALLIERNPDDTIAAGIENGTCYKCGVAIPGVWT